VKRYAFAGASGRALSMYARPMRERFAENAEPVGVFDPNGTRARYVADAAAPASGPPVPAHTDFQAMLRETRPDAVIVTTMDRYHDQYIIAALEAGCDAITEKPMTIDDAKCRAILAAERATGRKVTVTFNYRFSAYVTRIKELIRAGELGQITGVDFEWFLDRSHGADYFRRWHRRKENSGGLFVHKATHHFDLINWWLEDEPRDVAAFGDRRVYGPTRAERGERCSTCPHAATCEFFADFRQDVDKRALYFAAEHEDGYFRDRCVFADDIDIEDTMSATVRYRGGALLSYSLVAYAPIEGWRMSLNGTKGRLEAEEYHSGPRAADPVQQIALHRDASGPRIVEVPMSRGGHGGGDARLLEFLFAPTPPPDPLGHTAGSRAGAMSLLVGVAANRSIATGQRVSIDDLLAAPVGAGR
jgi:predicted dehydrogenase